MSVDLDRSYDVDALSLIVEAKREIARDIWLFDLVSMEGDDLPAFEPGAHLLVRTPAGVLRHYSICSSPSDRRLYQIGVKREPDGGGGSASMAEDLLEGDLVSAALPVNHFPLESSAGPVLLIAGGIGITPILAMARRLREQDRPFRLIYCARTPDLAAFADVLTGPEFVEQTVFHYDGGDPEKALDVNGLLESQPPDTQVYCCGPRGLMLAVREATRQWPPGHVHFEDFGGGAESRSDDAAFRVRLAKSHEIVDVGADETILEALRRQGFDVPSSCEAGACGACRTGLLAGVADHRDLVLADSERDGAIMICVSRALSDELTLDV